MSISQDLAMVEAEFRRLLLMGTPSVSQLLSFKKKILKRFRPKATKERPTRAKKNYRPAQVLLDYSIQRRTSEQVKADQAKAKTEAAAAEATAKAHHEIQKEQIAALEDAKQAEEYSRSLEELRPDLHLGHNSASATDVETLSDSHLTLDVPIDITREPLIDLPQLLPLEHSSYRSSSNSEEFLTGWLGGDAAVVEENNEDQDENYIMRSDNESEASEASCDQSQPQKQRHKAKAKPQVKVRFCFAYANHLLNRSVSTSEALSGLQ